LEQEFYELDNNLTASIYSIETLARYTFKHLSHDVNICLVQFTVNYMTQKAVYVCDQIIWNQIPPHIRNLRSALAFRQALKDLSLSANELDTVTHYQFHCCR